METRQVIMRSMKSRKGMISSSNKTRCMEEHQQWINKVGMTMNISTEPKKKSSKFANIKKS